MSSNRKWSRVTTLLESITRPDRRSRLKSPKDIPNAEIEFRSWLNPRFLTDPMSPQPELAGVRTALLGSLFLIFITIAVAFPLG